MTESYQWNHAPIHKINSKGTYIVTAGTYLKEHFFKGPERLDFLQTTLFKFAIEHNWLIQAWAIFSNHYHFIAQSSENPENLAEFIKKFHSAAAREVNSQDNTNGRQVWYQYWDTQLTHQVSYFARLKYVHNNPVKHKLVEDAIHYPWCSASWFNDRASQSFKRTINSFAIDQINLEDEF